MQQPFDCDRKQGEFNCHHEASTSKIDPALRAGSAFARADIFVLPEEARVDQ